MRAFYAEGVVQHSPGLPHLFAATLGRIARAVFNPEGVASRRLNRTRTRVLRNPFGVDEELFPLPRVAATRQPWAVFRNAFGVICVGTAT